MSISDNKNTPTERVKKPHLTAKNLEEYQPGASRTLVLDALKKVAKSQKLSRKNGGQPAPTSS